MVMISNKRVSDPFNDKIRARIFSSSGSSSGSEHDAETDMVSTSSSSSLSSPCLSYLVQNFLESSSPSTATTATTTTACDPDQTRDDSDSDSGEVLVSDPNALIRKIVNPIIYNNVDPFRKQLQSHVIKAIEIFSIFCAKNKSIFLRNIMAYLREIKYNAGICKTKWESSKNGSLTAGNYEFIDVLLPNSQVRYLIDVEFCDEFEIARATENHRILRASLPRVFVGKVDDLKKIVRMMCDEARRSMKINGLTLPPWRKNRYMQMKWFGAYRRTTNCFATNAVSSPNSTVKCRSVGFDIPAENGMFLFPPVPNSAVKCRSVGFDIPAENGMFLFPPVTRTR